jgi:YesN/AraC family two-component response regulator
MEALAETLMNHGLLVEDGGNSPARRILVVDDDPGILALHTRMISEALAGYQVIPARNGREALSVMRQLPPALVLLDLMMPEMDGFAVLEAMREEEAWRNIPVVVLTGQALTEEDMLRLNRGAVSVLSKGMYSADETLQHLSTALLHQRRPGSESQRLVSKAIAYINANYAGAVSLHDVASCVGLSERHLTRCFRQEIGITPITYLNRLRIKQAKALLEDGDGNSITRIGLDVGFSSSAYFTRVFKEEVGLSPREYLRKSQKCKSSS